MLRIHLTSYNFYVQMGVHDQSLWAYMFVILLFCLRIIIMSYLSSPNYQEVSILKATTFYKRQVNKTIK